MRPAVCALVCLLTLFVAFPSPSVAETDLADLELTMERTDRLTLDLAFVQAISWHMHRSTGVQMAHAELQNTRFGVTGIDEPREPAPTGLAYWPGFGTGGMTAGSSYVRGFASGDEPVKAWVERETAVGVVNGERHAGLTVWALPLQPA